MAHELTDVLHTGTSRSEHRNRHALEPHNGFAVGQSLCRCIVCALSCCAFSPSRTGPKTILAIIKRKTAYCSLPPLCSESIMIGMRVAASSSSAAYRVTEDA